MLKTGILEFNNLEKVIDLNEEGNPKIDNLLQLFSRYRDLKLKVDVIEVSKITSPSSIFIEISEFGFRRNEPKLIYFQKIRPTFIFQNGVFILDVKDFSELEFTLGDDIFSIKVHCEEEFEIKMYYSIDVGNNRRKL